MRLTLYMIKSLYLWGWKLRVRRDVFLSEKLRWMQIGDSVDDDDAMFIRQIDAIKDINCAFIETRKGMKLI